MITIKKLESENDFSPEFPRDAVVDFLYTHLKPYGDEKDAINKCIDYAFSKKEGMGGLMLTAHKGDKPVGVVVVNDTGMSGYIPDHILVYIAVDASERNQGIGKQLMEKTIELCPGDIKLHVEYENPAKRLYERHGFTSKYAEMRRVR